MIRFESSSSLSCPWPEDRPLQARMRAWPTILRRSRCRFSSVSTATLNPMETSSRSRLASDSCSAVSTPLATLCALMKSSRRLSMSSCASVGEIKRQTASAELQSRHVREFIGSVIELGLSSITLLGDLEGLIKEADSAAIARRIMVADDTYRGARSFEFDLKVLIYR